MAMFRIEFIGSVIDGINKYRCTTFSGVPTTFSILMRRSQLLKRRFPSLRIVAQAGGAMADHMIRELKDGLPDTQIFVMYGMTEGSARLSYLPPHMLDTKLGSIGKGIPGVDLRVVDEEGRRVAPGEIGEIIAKGDNIMLGYLDDPAETARVIRNGWLHSGDAATIDEDGFIYVLFRKDGLIKSAGHRISPLEIERAILAHPKVVQCGAVGVEDRFLGQAIVAYIAAEEDDPALEAEIAGLCRRTLSTHKLPKYYRFLSSLPLNPSSKLDRAALRERASIEFRET